MIRKSDNELNSIFNEFANAAHLHYSIHILQINMPVEVAKLSPTVREIKTQLYERSMELIAKQRDENLNSAMSRYSKWKEKQDATLPKV